MKTLWNPGAEVLFCCRTNNINVLRATNENWNDNTIEDDDVDAVVMACLTGSETLSRWRRLATPNLAGVLEYRPGVQVKGQHLATYFEEEKYSIGDYEEDGMSLYYQFWNLA